MKNKALIIFILSLISLTLFSFARAQDERGKITIQGWLTDANKNPLTGTYTFNFSIYDSPTGGSLLWSQVKQVQVNNGIFSTEIGPIGLTFNIPYYLEISINNEILRPRYNLTAAPYSFVSIYGGIGEIKDIWVNETGDIMTGDLRFVLSDRDYAIQINTTTDYGTIVVNGSALQIWSNKLNSRGNLWVNWINSTGLCLSNDCRSSWPVGISNAFARVENSAGTLQFSASGEDKIQFAAGPGLSVSFDPTNKRVTFTNTGDTNAGDDITGSGTPGSIARFTGSQTIGNSVIYQSGEYIGIGTTSPVSKLHLYSGPDLFLTLETSAPSLVDIFSGSVSGYAAIDILSTTNSRLDFRAKPLANKGQNAGVTQTIMTLTATGNVGIGTTNPDTILTINLPSTSGSAGRDFIKVTGGNADSYRAIVINRPELRFWSTDRGNWADIYAFNGTFVGNLSVDGKIYGWNVPSDVKLTTAVHQGNFGGYNGMYNFIQANGCSGYHVCTQTEVMRWLETGHAFPQESCWTYGDQYDCGGWWSDASADTGTGFYNAPNTYPQARTFACSTAQKVCCCK